ncbi:uncharacterized protein BX664DRAFT_279532 [Halteromyces radiatus]|uniref:uncharacterized protein n=1 Tax=Halteromyces radiatus TaxID=101107 RepID=UPI00221F06C0|nr:uncharacterized protein BX664DRAFT_279532 [Halteromyces radiatus]KAI8088890.1 hypothetical protein BX664DRAFT_279532 [Halteromyces radiatus]
MLGSNHHTSSEWLSKDDTSSLSCQDILVSSSSPPKKKSMERLSRIFQKKSKHKKSLPTVNTPEPPTFPMMSRHTSIHSTQSADPQASFRFNSTSKKGGEKMKRFSSLRHTDQPKTQQEELVQRRKILEQLHEEKETYHDDNQRLEQELTRLQQRIEERTLATTQLRAQYDLHVSSLRATSDDLGSVRTKLIQVQQSIAALADRLLPHISPDHTSSSLASFWLNLRQVIESMCPLSPTMVRHLTEKFIMDVLVQNFNLSEIAGCACSDDYAQIALWFLDHDDMNSKPSSISISSSTLSTDVSDCMVFSIRLRQQVASTVVAAQLKRDDVKQQLQQVVQAHWKYLYGGLAKAFPYIYQHDTTLEPDVQKHFGAQIQTLVEQAVALGFAIKGLEVDITAADVQEGSQVLDLTLMDEVQGLNSGIIQFCISPPFKVFNRTEPLVKGKVLCLK